jgi:DNA-binding winged helix-turn-helix (wHTH) protein
MATAYKPKQISKKLLAELGERALDVVSNRFGLTPDAERKTLESIGQKYGITRERVRQIENAALSSIRKSEAFEAHTGAFDELQSIIHGLGGVVSEEELLSHVSKDSATQNHVHFHLSLADHFVDHRENEHFKKRWSVREDLTDSVHDALKNLYKSISLNELLSEDELVKKFIDHLEDIAEEVKDEEIVKRWLRLSKKIDSNPLGEWGRADSKSVRVRGVKDYAFLVMRRHGSPMHFREVAQAITETFGKKTHPATTHNELIKDERFVLVGRGLYGLREWGYKPGVVADVIRGIIEKEGPLSKEDIIDRVLKERYLKRNTILVNLQNPKKFKKNKEGLYTVA